MNHWCSSYLRRTIGPLAALGLSGWIVCCALSASAQGTAETPPRPTASPTPPADAKPPLPPRVGGDRGEAGADFRPSKPDVYYLRDKDGKLVPVPDFSYEDFKRLYDLDRKLTDAAAPPRYVLSQLSITGKVENDQARLQIQVRVTTKTDGWVNIPLRFSGAVLRDQPKFDGAGKVLVEYHRERDGYVVWLQASDAKPHVLSFETVVPIKKNGGTRRLALSAPNAAVSELRLTVPGKRIAATVSEGAGLLGIRPVDAEGSEIQVAGVGGDFQLTWLDAPAESAGIPATVEATSAVLVRIEGPRRLTSEARLKVRSYGIPLTTFRVKLPAGLEWFPLNEAGYRVNLVETLREPEKPPVSVVEVTLENKIGFFTEVRLRAVTPAREAVSDERIETLGFDVVGAVRQFGQADFVVDGDWGVTWPERQNVQQVEVPDALRQQRVVARFEYFRQPCSLTVQVQPRKTRINVEPEYTLHVGPQALRLVAVLRYRVRGPNADRVQMDLSGWKLDQLQPETLVDRDLVRENAGGVLTLPLASDPATALQEFELRLEASRAVPAAAEVLTVPLPRLQADTLSPARLFVIPADNVSLSPRLRDMPGGVAQLTPMGGTAGAATPANNMLSFELRADVEQPRFVADFKLRARQLTAGLDHQLRVEPRRIVVEQRFACRVAYEPLKQLRLAVPEAVAAAGFQAFLERGSGELEALTPNAGAGADAGPSPGTVFRSFDLSPEQLGEFLVVIRYTVPWSPETDDALTTTLRVPLIMPAEEASTRLSGNAVRIAREPAWRVDVPDVGWVPDLRTGERGGEAPELVRTAAGWADEVTLEITPVRSLENLGTVVRQAWVQSWFGRQWRQDRVVLRVQSSDRRLLVSLPRDVERDDLLVAVNGRRVNPSVSTEGTVRVDWESTDSQAERTVELSYLAPRGTNRSGLLAVTLPQVVGARGEQRWLWQLVLPPDEHLVVAPAGWVAQRRWLWQAGFIDRRMNGTQGELERALHASAQVEPPADANQYLFSNFAPDAVVEVRVVDRTVLVLVASGILLLAGLMAIYFPRLRHPAMLWLLGVAGVGIAVITPALAALTLQAGTLGIALSLCGLMLRRIVRRRQTQRTVVRGSAVSVVDKPLSDLRKPRPDSNVHATTATLPPTLGVLLLVGASAWFVAEVRGQTPSPPPAAVRLERGIGFRRVLVREEQIPELARGHLPLARVEFEQLLETAQRQLPEGAPATRIEQADYITRWESATLITGEARLRVRHAGGPAAILSLEPCDLPILEARWSPVHPPSVETAGNDPESAGGSPLLARIGATTTAGPCVVVEREADLNWRFALRGEGDPKNGGRFRARLPRSPRQRWWLELPDPLVPQVADAVVVGPGAETLLADVPAAVRPTPGRVWWCLELGGRTHVDCSVRSPAAGEPWSPPFSWRQDAQYDVSLNGTELRSTFRVDVSSDSLTSLSFEIPTALHIGSVRLGDTALAWATRPGPLAEKREVQVDLPELLGSDRVLTITALASTPLGAAWTLPRIECRGGFWQESSASVTVAEPLQIQSLQIRGGRQTRVSSLATPVAAVSLGVQFHDADGRVELALGVPAAQIRTLVGTTVSIDAATLTARAEATINVARGHPFRISADVPQAWIVDGIEYSPEALVEDYSWEPSPRKDRQRLTLQLRNPLPRERGLRLGIRAHRPRPADHEALLADSLRVLDFVSDEELSADGRYLVAVHADPSAPLHFRGDGDVTWLQAGQLAGPEAELVDADADYLYVDGRDAAGLKGISERRPDAYAADLEVVARTLRDRVQERYRISCQPLGAPVSRLVAIFSQARSAPLTWNIAEDADALFTARRLSDRELAAVTRAAGEGWEVLLRTPQPRPFTLRAERISPWNDKLPLALISLPESETQRGVVRVESVGETAMVSQVGLEGVPASATEHLDAETWVAGYRYDPARSPLVTIAPSVSTDDDAAAWAWSSELVTHHLEQGTRCHDLSYWLENCGARQVLLRLPAASEGLSLSVNGISRASLVERRDGELAVTIPLPAGERHVLARVTFRTRDKPLRGIMVLKPIQPALDVPVLAQTWVACVPAAYRPWERASAPRLEGPNAAVEFVRETVGQRLVALVAPFFDDAQPSPLERGARARVAAPDDLLDPKLVWRRHVQIASSRTKMELRIVDGELMNGASWVLLLLVAGGIAWPTAGWPRWSPLWLCLLLAALPWIPAGWDPAPSGVFFGMLLGAAIGLVRRSQSPDLTRAAHEGSTRRFPTVASVTTGAVIVSVGFAVGFPVVVAQEPPPVTREEFQVLYPVDEEGRPVGEYVHVPQAFYQELRRRARGAGGPLPGWMWRAANYRVLVRDVNGSNERESPGWEVPSVTAQWEVDVLAPDQRVTIPGNPVWGSLLSQRILREGQDVDSSLESGPEGWSVVLGAPGRYQIQVAWRPALRPRSAQGLAGATGSLPLGERWGFSQGIPRIPESRLTIEFPDGQRWLELPSVRGAVTRDGPGREWRADLGPVDQLIVEGVGGTADANPAMPVNVDQLVWFHLRPGSVTLETQWTFATTEGKLPRLARLAIDPRLRLLPLAPDQPIARHSNPEGATPWIQWEWDDTVRDQARIRLSFLVAGSTGIGQWRLPRLQPWNARVERRLLAVSAVSSLETQRSGPTTLQPIAVPEFMEAWGEASPPPQMAFRLSAGDSPWSLVTRLREARIQATQTTELSVDIPSANVLWAADIEVADGVVWQHSVVVPEALRVRDISLVDRAREENRILYWSRPAPNRVQILLNAPLDGSHRLTISGELPVADGTDWRFPAISLDGVQPTAQRGVIYRQPTTLVTWDEPAPLGLTRRAVAEYRPGWGRRVGEWNLPGPEPAPLTSPLVLHVRENRLKTRLRIGTTLLPGDEGFVSEVLGHVAVETGELDALRLETPADWPAQLSIEPPLPYQWRAAPGSQTRKILVLRPNVPWTKSFDFRIRGPNAGASQDRFDIPDVRVLDLDDVEYYLWLPRHDQTRQVAWETSGLQATKWPDGLPFSRASGTAASVVSVPPDADEGTAYRVVGTRFRVSLRNVEGHSGTPRVRLADHHVFLDAQATGGGVSVLDIEAAGQAACVVSLPDFCDLVNLRVDGRNVRRQAIGPRQWRVELAGADWPQRLEIVFVAAAEPLDDRRPARTLPCASVVDWPLQRFLGTLTADRTVEVGGGPMPAADENWVSQDLERLAAASELAETAAETLISHPRQDAADWWPAWQERFSILETRLFGQRTRSPSWQKMAESEAEPSRRRFQQAKGRLRVAAAPRPAGGVATPAERVNWEERLADLGKESGGAVERVRWALKQDPGPIVVSWRPAHEGLGGNRLAWSLMCVVAGLACLVLSAGGRAAQAWARWPQLVLVLVGLGWWVAGPWPGVGLAVVAAGVLAALRGEWGHSVAAR